MPTTLRHVQAAITIAHTTTIVHAIDCAALLPFPSHIHVDWEHAKGGLVNRLLFSYVGLTLAVCVVLMCLIVIVLIRCACRLRSRKFS